MNNRKETQIEKSLREQRNNIKKETKDLANRIGEGKLENLDEKFAELEQVATINKMKLENIELFYGR